MNIIWSATAEKTYLFIIAQVLEKWTPKEAKRFITDVDKLLMAVSKNNHICPVSKIYNLRKCIVNRHTSLVYRISKNKIELVTFLYNKSGHSF